MLEEPEQAKQRLGYLPENAPLYSDMTVAVADVVANTVWSAGMGAVAGLVLKRKAA